MVECECGKSYTKSNRARHMKSAYHKKRVGDDGKKVEVSDIYECCCGRSVSKRNKAKHLKSKVHHKEVRMQHEYYKHLETQYEFAKDDKGIVKKIGEMIFFQIDAECK